MYKFIIAFLLSLILINPVNAQKYVPYKEIYQESAENGKLKPGTYYVLVWADWCAPCKKLKESLKRHPDLKIYDQNFDTDKELVNKIMGDHKTIPCFVKYEVSTFINKRNVFLIGNDLDSFINNPVKEEISVENDGPSKDLFDRVLEKRFDKVDALNTQILEGLLNVNSRVSILESLSKKMQELRDSDTKMQGLLEKLLDKNADYEPVLKELRAERERFKLLSGRFDIFEKNLSDAIKNLGEFNKDRETIFKGLQEFRKEKDGILAGIRESREEVKVFGGLLSNLRDKLDSVETKSNTDREKFRPFVNLIERFNTFYNAITESVWILIGCLLSIFVAIIMAIVMLMVVIAAVSKFLKAIAIKLGLSWLFI